MSKLVVLALAFALSSEALASTVITLPGRNSQLGSSGELPVMMDLSKELSQKSLSPQSLLQVEVIAKAGPTGAIYALMMSGIAVDSFTVLDDKEVSVVLKPDSDVTPTPWVLGVRGDVQIKEIRVTVGKADAPRETPPSTPPPALQPKDPPPPEPSLPPPAQTKPLDDDLLGRRVIVVSRSSGTIDFVIVDQLHSDGTYTVLYQGLPYSGFRREQIAVLEGCVQGACVGQRIRIRGENALLLGLLPSGEFVVEWSQGSREIWRPEAEAPPAQAPKPDPEQRNAWNVQRGQVVLYVFEDDSVARAQVLSVETRGLRIRFWDTGEELTVPPGRNLARLNGCAGNFCVGDPVLAADSVRAVHPAEVIAIQSPTHVVVRLWSGGWEIANWPIRALRARR